MLILPTMNQRYIFTVCVVAIFCLFAEAQQTVTGTLTHDNLTRDYRLRLPKNFSVAEKLPLVFNFHGYTSNAGQQEFYSGMNATADKERFAVCYPNGINAAWNVGWNFGSTADDVGFVEAMIEKFVTEYGFDRNRIYSCGMSNGGFFSYHLACKIPHKIAAIASVTGSMVPASLITCQPGTSMPVLEMHGTADDVVQYNGSPAISAPIDSVISFWVKNNRCIGMPVTVTLPNINTQDQSTVEKTIYADCEKSHKVILYKILGGGHTWPSATIPVGVTNRDINANEEIWNFFKTYSLSTTSETADEELTSFVYPNPTSDMLYVQADKDIRYAEILSLAGSPLIYADGNLLLGGIQMHVLPAGIYLLKLVSVTGTVFQKIQKM